MEQPWTSDRLFRQRQKISVKCSEKQPIWFAIHWWLLKSLLPAPHNLIFWKRRKLSKFSFILPSTRRFDFLLDIIENIIALAKITVPRPAEMLSYW